MKLINLVDNTLVMLPDGIKVLNPEDEGVNGYIYSVYFTAADNPCYFEDALRGEALFSPCAYLGSRPDLHFVLSGASSEGLDCVDEEGRHLLDLVMKEADAHPMPNEWICFITLQGPGDPKGLGAAIFGKRAENDE